MIPLILAYVIPVGVSVYGAVVMFTGEISGFGSRMMRGAAARFIGLVLLAALPLAIVLGPMIRINPLVTKSNHAGHLREAEITREILNLHRELSDWQSKNAPPRDTEPKDGQTNLDRLKEQTRALQEFNVEYKKRIAEKDARVQLLKDEQSQLRHERESRKTQPGDGQSGPMWVGAGVWLAAWVTVTLFGRRYEAPATPPNPSSTPSTGDS